MKRFVTLGLIACTASNVLAVDPIIVSIDGDTPTTHPANKPVSITIDALPSTTTVGTVRVWDARTGGSGCLLSRVRRLLWPEWRGRS